VGGSCQHGNSSLGSIPEVLKLKAPPGERVLLVLWGGASCLYEGHMYFGRSMGATYNIFKALCLVEIFYLSLSTGTGSKL
jgi:hypothetical protein